MKSICLIASTLLIVLISQHTNGLPLDRLTTEHPCLKGYEFVDGKCTPILTEKELEPVRKVESEKLGACPEGKVHGKHGICEDIKPEDLLVTTFRPEEHESKSFHHKEEEEHEEDVTKPSHVTDEYETKLSEDTTDLSDTKEKFSGVNIPKGCPPGTKPDEQGACQDEVESSSKKPTIDFKDLLAANGTCPYGMEMFKDKCVYVKSKQTLQVDPMFDLTDDETKDKKITEADELVPLLARNVCPHGTEYYSNGLCRRRTRPSSVNVVHSDDKLCRVDEILVDGKCTRKEIESPLKTDLEVKETKSEEKTVQKLTKRAVPW